MRFLLLISIFLASSSSALAGSCGSGGEPRTLFQSITGALNAATTVFRGRVTGWEWREGDLINRNSEQLSLTSTGPAVETRVVKLKVDRWWKTAVDQEIFVLTSRTRDKEGIVTSSSDYNFKEGQSYIVFAIGTETLLRIGCSMVLPMNLKGIEEVIEILGAGMPPRDPAVNVVENVSN